MAYDWDFMAVWTFRESLFRGLAVSIGLTAGAIACGLPLGLALALLSLSRRPFVARSTIALVELLRAIPLLVLLVWLYFCMPIVIGVGLSATPTAVLAMSLNFAPFAAETIRGGILSVSFKHYEVALALGMSHVQVITRIVLPQAVRNSAPSLVGLGVSIFKLSSLASVISVTELLHAANNVVTVTFRPLETLTVVACLYMAVTLPLTLFLRRVEQPSAKSFG